MLNHGLQGPGFDDVRGDFVVTFYGSDGIDKKDNDTLNDTLSDTLNNTSKIIIEALMKDCSLTQKEVSQNTGFSIITVKRYLSELQHKGLIEREGSKKSGYWKVKNI